MYFGSVRFFKNLILVVVIALIAVPVVFAFRLNQRAVTAEADKAALAHSVNELDLRVAELELLLEEQQNTPQAPADPEPAPTDPNGWEGLEPEHPAYQDLYPDMYIEGRPTPDYTTGVAYLTFDDGPSDRTMDILTTLSEKNVKATFFVNGPENETKAQRLRQIAEAGHSIGVHSYSHEYKDIYSSVEDFLDDFYKSWTMIQNAIGTAPEIFRFPGGSINSYNNGIYQDIVAEMLRRGFLYYDWNASAGDSNGQTLSQDSVYYNVVNSCAGKGRCIILMHDSQGLYSTASALPDIIDALQTRGYTFDRLTRNVQPVTFGY